VSRPVSAVRSASIALVVRYGVYIRWILPLMGILLAIIIVVFLIGAAI
jgi:hypothetical protein